jgi:hypothetical protein
MGSMQDELVNELGVNPDIPRIRSALTVLRSLFETIQPTRESDIEYLRLKSVTVDQSRIRIKCVITSVSNVGELRKLFDDGVLVVNGEKIPTKFSARPVTNTPDGYRNLDCEIELGGDR